MLVGIIYAVAALAGLAWTALLAAAVYILPYAICYNKDPGCGAGVLAVIAALITYVIGIAVGIVLTRLLARLAAKRSQRR
jgi:hypothetical protein